MDNEEVPAFLKPYPVEHVAMEATTSIAPLYRRLDTEGYQVHVAHPKETRPMRRPASRRTEPVAGPWRSSSG